MNCGMRRRSIILAVEKIVRFIQKSYDKLSKIWIAWIRHTVYNIKSEYYPLVCKTQPGMTVRILSTCMYTPIVIWEYICMMER